MQWHYAKGGRQFGPVEEAELFRLAQTGELSPSDLVWNPTMGPQWVAASTVPNLFSPPAAGEPLAAPIAIPFEPGRTHNRDLMRMARESLAGQWGPAILAGVLLFIAHIVVRGICAVAIWCPLWLAGRHTPFQTANLFSGLGSLIVGGPLYFGCALFFLTLVRKKGPRVEQLFEGFNRFGVTLCACLLIALFTSLWMLLLIVPGIVAALAYSMTYYVIADNPGIGALDAITKSKQMMHGHKWKYFCLQWRFVGWALLCLLTCGVGFLWLFPYMNTAKTHFYEDVRPRQA